MNIERLHAIALAIINDINSTKTQITLQQLVTALQNQVNQPQAPAFQQQVSQHLQTLDASLSSAPSNDFSPVWKQALKELGMHELLGNNLRNHIKEIFERNQITPSIALKDLQSLSTQLTNRKEALEQVLASFKKLEIGEEKLEPGQCEVGVLVPRLAINNRLNEFAKDLDELDKIFATFSELTTGSRPGFQIRSISSSDLSVFLNTLPIVAAGIALAVDRIVVIYKHILEIRKLRGELKKQGVSNKDLKGVSSHADNMMKSEIEKLIPELLDKYYVNNDKERRNELTTELRFSLNKIARRIDKGYSLEIRVQPLSEEGQTAKGKEKASKDAEHIKVILSVSKNLEFLRLEGEPILTLPESQDSVEEKKD
jgi:hypothetical protein